ncbi:MAG: hypothetical protein O3A00_10550 [Planctomycetota bacterium]|nr:hypothetical protein [Planctomycetota bacterium]
MLAHATQKTALTIVGAYDEFLSVLGSSADRGQLQKLDASTATSDDLFLRMRKLSHKYNAGLEELFFDSKEFALLTRKYGVF